MTSLRNVAGSLLWLATITSAQFLRVTQPPKPAPTGNRLPPAIRASTPTSTVPPEILPKPTMYILDSSQPDYSQPPVDCIQLDRTGDVSLEQAMVFRGIPAGAQNCQLKWMQADESERNFTVGRHGRTIAHQLTGFPTTGAEGDDAPVSLNSVLPFDNGNTTRFSPDFTQWPENHGPWDHLAGTIPCSEDIFLRIRLNEEEGDGFVHLDQDEKNGFYIQYTLQ